MENNQPKLPLGHGLVPMGYWKRLWFLWGALIIKIVISFMTTIGAEMIYVLSYAYKDPEKFIQLANDKDAIFNFSLEIVEALMPYTTVMEGFAAAITIPILFFMFRSDVKRERAIGFVPAVKAPFIKYGLIVMISIAMCIGMNNVMYISNLTVIDETYTKVTEAMYAADFLTELICLGILVPIAEELVFRGMMYKRLRYDLRYMSAALYSAFAFAVFHGNLVQIIYAFVLGMLFTYMYDKYGSIWAPILAHIVMNVVSVIATEVDFMTWMSEEYIRIGTITVVCAAVASTMFVLIQRMENSN